MYGPIKTHKPNKTNPTRIITSRCDTAEENLSIFVEAHPSTEADKLPSRIKDSSHMLNIIDQLNNSGNTYSQTDLNNISNQLSQGTYNGSSGGGGSGSGSTTTPPPSMPLAPSVADFAIDRFFDPKGSFRKCIFMQQ